MSQSALPAIAPQTFTFTTRAVRVITRGGERVRLPARVDWLALAKGDTE